MGDEFNDSEEAFLDFFCRNVPPTIPNSRFKSYSKPNSNPQVHYTYEYFLHSIIK